MKLEEFLPSNCDLTVLDAGSGTVQTQPDGFSVVWFDGIDGVSRLSIASVRIIHSPKLVGLIIRQIHDGKSMRLTFFLSVWCTDPEHNGLVALEMPEFHFEVRVAAHEKGGGYRLFQKEKFNFRRPTIEEESGEWWKYSTGNHEVCRSASHSEPDS